jgi:hypothetical protein
MRNGKRRAARSRAKTRTRAKTRARSLPAVGAVPIRTFEELERLSIDHCDPDVEALANWLLWYRLGRKRIR